MPLAPGSPLERISGSKASENNKAIVIRAIGIATGRLLTIKAAEDKFRGDSTFRKFKTPNTPITKEKNANV